MMVGAYEGAFVPATFRQIVGRELIIESTGAKNKRLRAINANVHTAWNEGWLTIPLGDQTEDMVQFILCVTNFIGDHINNGFNDDFVDALVAGYDVVKEIKKKKLLGNISPNNRMSTMEAQMMKKRIKDMGGRYYRPRD